MIFYIESDNYLSQQYNNLIDDLNNIQKSQRKKLDILLECLNSINFTLQSKNNIENPGKIINLLETIKSISDKIRKNISHLEKLKKELSELYNNHLVNMDIFTIDIKEKLNKYNTNALECKNNIYSVSEKYDEFINNYLINHLSINAPLIIETPDTYYNIENSNIEETQILEQKNDESISTPNIKDNRILLISEKQKKVFLPYFANDLEKILKQKPKYNSLQQIIDSKYVLPITKFNNSTLSRFKEAYNLMRKREKASISDSISLATEVSFISSLNPAIITACRNLHELDLYLDSLQANQPEKFDIFEIKYEFLPTKN